MNTIISLISDLILLIFDLSLYTHLTKLKKEDALHRGIMYAGIAAITAAYVAAAYGLHVPYAAASFLCMTVPSFLLFLWLSKYKNARFLVTFCFVDTVTFIIAVFGKFAQVLGGSVGGVSSCFVMLILTCGVFWLLRPYFPKYRMLMEQVSKGWTPMAVSTVFIYILLAFSAAYPKPLLSRMEYLPVYLLLCATIGSFYGVFIVLLLQKAKLTRANLLLQQQQHWHDLAYLDELTQLANPAAYAARTGELQAETEQKDSYALLVFDIDSFKAVNDTYGHLVGNRVLKETAEFFLSSFSQEHYEFFRIGGDEFAAIARNVPKDELEKKVREINTLTHGQNPGCTYSCGWAAVDFSQEKSFERAFNLADRAMYQVKIMKKNQK